MPSFVQNVNILASKIDVIIEANSIFDGGVVPVLSEIAELDLQEVTSDLKKGTFFGERKIDIDLALNKVGIAGKTDFNEIMAIWTNTQNTVYYNSAVARFMDGSSITITFVNEDGQPELVSSHGGIVDQLEDNVAFQDTLVHTNIQEDVGGKAGSFIRITDVLGHASNLNELLLSVHTGDAVEQVVTNYWGKTTSALQVLADKSGHIIDLLDSIEEITAVSSKIEEIAAVGAAIDSVIGIYTKLTEITTVGLKLLEIEIVADNIADVEAVSNSIAAVNTISNDISRVITVATNIANVNTVALNMAQLLVLRDNITQIQMVYSNIAAITAIGNNIVNLVTLANNLEDLQPLVDNIDGVVLIAANIDIVLRAGENVEVIEDMRDEAVTAAGLATLAKDAAVAASSAAEVSKTSANISEQNALTYANTAFTNKEIAVASATSASTSASNANTYSQAASSNADRAESALENLNAISVIPIWVTLTSYGIGDMVIDTNNAEIYLCIQDIAAGTDYPSADAGHWKRVLGVSLTIDGGYANNSIITQTFDGGTANG